MHCLNLQLGLLRAGQSSHNSQTATPVLYVARAHRTPTVPTRSYFHTLLCQELHPWPRTAQHGSSVRSVSCSDTTNSRLPVESPCLPGSEDLSA